MLINVSTGVHNTSGDLFTLSESHAKLIMRQNYFVIKCINNWNTFSSDIVCASNCAVFKNGL